MTPVKTLLLVGLVVWLVLLVGLAVAYARGRLRKPPVTSGEWDPPFGLRSRLLGHGPFRGRKDDRSKD